LRAFDRFWMFAIVMLLSVRADAGILMRADWQGVDVQAEVATDFTRVRLEIDGRPFILDAENGILHDLQGRKAHEVDLQGVHFGRSVVPFSLRKWSNGPPVAGHRTRYNVLEVDELVCGEVLDSGWMAPFMENIIKALAMVQSLDDRLAPVDRGPCGAASFEVYARNGWPLVIGWRDSEIFRTHTLRFDHKPERSRMTLPIIR
jgi:hypothetical protein